MTDSGALIDDIMRLRATWKKNNWTLNTNENHVFEIFCRLFTHFSQEQIQLIHELTENYLWITSKEYEDRFDNLINSIDEQIFKNCKTIYLFSIVKPGDEHKIKSGQHCLYCLKGPITSFNPKFQNKTLETISDFGEFKKHMFKNDGTELIILVDDYIGTGETFEEAWVELEGNTTIDLSTVILLTLAIQQEAYDIIKSKGISIFTTEIRKKGISDYYISPEKEEKIRIMEEIESIIKIKYFSFGFKRSEGLITLMRTPDNTFPFFWMKYKIKNIDYNGPFLRT